MIRVEGLTKDYGPRRAIEELTFDAERGEMLGFLGPNGAGKTTTMRILTGYMPPTSGKAEIGGFDVIENSLEVRRIVGYMPETVPLYTEMTVFDYLKFYADLRKIKDGDDRVDLVIVVPYAQHLGKDLPMFGVRVAVQIQVFVELSLQPHSARLQRRHDGPVGADVQGHIGFQGVQDQDILFAPRVGRLRLGTGRARPPGERDENRK